MPNTPGDNVKKFRQSQVRQRNGIGGNSMPESSKHRLKMLRKQLGALQRRRAACKGDPEMLREIDDQSRVLKDEIRKLER